MKEQGNQAERRKAKFATMKETEGPRKGLTKSTGRAGTSPAPMIESDFSGLHAAGEAMREK